MSLCLRGPSKAIIAWRRTIAGCRGCDRWGTTYSNNIGGLRLPDRSRVNVNAVQLTVTSLFPQSPAKRTRGSFAFLGACHPLLQHLCLSVRTPLTQIFVKTSREDDAECDDRRLSCRCAEEQVCVRAVASLQGAMLHGCLLGVASPCHLPLDAASAKACWCMEQAQCACSMVLRQKQGRIWPLGLNVLFFLC